MHIKAAALAMAIGLVSTFIVTVGCGGGTESSSAPAAGDESDFTGGKAGTPGMKDLASQLDGDKPSGVAVAGGNAYLALGNRGVAFVDLKTMKVTKLLHKDEAGRLIGADSISVVGASGDELMVAGLRNDAPIDPFRGGSNDVFVITLLDRVSGATKKEVVVEIMDVISSPRDSLFDIPDMAARIDDASGKVFLMIAHNRAKKVLSFALPSAKTSTLKLKDLMTDASAVTVDNGKDIALHGGSAWVPIPSDRSAGYIKRIDLATKATSKFGANLGYPIGVAFSGSGAVLVANHESSLFVLDPTTGATLKEIEVPDWVTGVTSDKDNIYVSTWKGVFLIKNEWP